MSNGPLSLRLTWLATKIAGTFSTKLAGRFAARLWFTPWRVPETEKARNRRRDWLAQTEPLTIPIDGFDLRGFTAGDGPVVLLVHGWGDKAASLGRFIEPLVSRGYRVVGVDLPAHGETSQGRTHALEVSRAIRQAADHVGGVHSVIAHSMGAVGTMLALQDGLTLRTMVLVSPPVRLEHGIDHFAKMFSLSARAKAGLRQEIEKLFGPSVWEDIALDNLAQRVDLPTLIVHDREDSQVSFDDVSQLAAGWPSARFEVTEGLGHTRILREPAVVKLAVSHLREVLVGV